VGDSSEQNGSFKMALYKAKRNYLTYRDVSDQQFVPTNIIALVKTAWKDSFACVRQLRKAIMQWGWNPLNYVLLDNPALALKKPTDSSLLTVTVSATGTISTSDLTVTVLLSAVGATVKVAPTIQVLDGV
jgi:hypothetical protein